MSPSLMSLIVLDFPPLSGGISHHLYELVSHLPPECVQVIGLPTPNHQQFDARQPFSIERIGRPVSWDRFERELKFLGPFYLQRLLRTQGSRFVICGQAHYSLMFPAWFYSRINDASYGIFAYGLDLLYPQTQWYGRFFNMLLRRADVIFTDSEKAREIAIDLGVDPDKAVIVHPAVSSVRYTNTPSPSTVLQRHGLQGKKCILTVGRLVERKGHDTVIRALPSVLDAIPEAHYLIVGKGNNRSRLSELVNSLGLRDYVTFTGHVPDEELPAYYQACDVFAMISREISETGDMEGFGIVYLEANLMGKPVVAGRSGGVADAVIHEQTGLLVDPLNSTEVAAALVRVMTDSELAGRLGIQGRNRVESQFSSKAMAQKVLSTLSAKVM